jgi:hypothetical protein
MKCQTTIARCVYCLGFFEADRAHAETCSGACRQARFAALALTPEELVDLRPWARRHTFSPEREAATGLGGMTATATWEADNRVRALAGLEAAIVGYFGPGYGPGDIHFEWRADMARAKKPPAKRYKRWEHVRGPDGIVHLELGSVLKGLAGTPACFADAIVAETTDDPVTCDDCRAFAERIRSRGAPNLTDCPPPARS